MRKIYYFVALAIVLPLLSMTVTFIDLETKSILENLASIKVPTHFKELSKQEKIADYSAGERPQTVFTNAEKTVFLTFDANPSFQGVTPEKINKVKDYYVELNNYYGTCTDSGIFENNNKKYGFVKVDGLTKKTKKVYVVKFFSDFNGHLLEGTFYCPADKKTQWESTANEIMRSYTIKKHN